MSEKVETKAAAAEARHTAGPWYVHDPKGWPLVFGPDNRMVAKVDTSLQGDVRALPTAQANARLIAAAPELLNELRFLVDIICHSERMVTLEDCDAAKAAIAKAEGRQL